MRGQENGGAGPDRVGLLLRGFAYALESATAEIEEELGIGMMMRAHVLGFGEMPVQAQPFHAQAGQAHVELMQNEWTDILHQRDAGPIRWRAMRAAFFQSKFPLFRGVASGAGVCEQCIGVS